MKKPILVAISSQKGGVGKSTMTILLASYLHYLKGYNVAVIDCDSPQHSLFMERNRELKDYEEDQFLKKILYDSFVKNQKRAYPVLEATLENALEVAQVYLDTEIPDFLFFDLPGTINNYGVVDILRNMHYVFCPIVADRYVLDSGVAFCNYVKESLMTTGNAGIKGLYAFWNMVKPSERTDLYKIYDDFMEQEGFHLMKSRLNDSVRFKREGSRELKRAVFRSTLVAPDKSLLRGSGLDGFVEEFIALTTK